MPPRHGEHIEVREIERAPCVDKGTFAVARGGLARFPGRAKAKPGAHASRYDPGRLKAVRHAPVAKVNDARAKCACLDQLKVDSFLQGREVGRAAAE